MWIRRNHLESSVTAVLVCAVLTGLIVTPVTLMASGSCAIETVQAEDACCGSSCDDCCCCGEPASADDNPASPSRDTQPGDHDCPCHVVCVTHTVPMMVAADINLLVNLLPHDVHHAADDTLPSNDWRLSIFHPPS